MTEKDKHHWSGWPGACCLKCFCEDPLEIALGNDWWKPDFETNGIKWLGTPEQKARVDAAEVCPVKGELVWNKTKGNWDLVT